MIPILILKKYSGVKIGNDEIGVLFTTFFRKYINRFGFLYILYSVKMANSYVQNYIKKKKK